MAELLATGGCYDSMRFAKDGAGANVRDWLAEINTAAQMTTAMTLILGVALEGDDMNVATDATFKIQWRNITDAGSWTDLASTGELHWSTTSDLTNGNSVDSAADSGGHSLNCMGKGWTVMNSREQEGVNGITFTCQDDEYLEFHWAIDLDSADGPNEDEYQFRICESGGSVIGTCNAYLTVVTAGKITGVTKNADRSAVVGGVTVTAMRSDGAGSNPKPVIDKVPRAQTVSDGTTGAYTLLGDLVSGATYFLHFYKDDTDDLSDGSPPVTAVDA